MSAQLLQSFLTPCDPMDCSPSGSSVGIFQHEFWSGLPFPTLGDLPDPGSEPVSPVFPALQADSLPMEPQGSHHLVYITHDIFDHLRLFFFFPHNHLQFSLVQF